MLLNANREAVWACPDPATSTCPFCKEKLVAKRPLRHVHHWAHYPREHDVPKCPHKESDWHLKIKLAYATFPDWEIEVPVEIGDKTYRIDAINEKRGEAREFIHTLTPYYLEKQHALRLLGMNIKWIFDGEEFHSARCRYTKDYRGLRRLMKPKAFQLALFLNQVTNPADPDVAVHVQELFNGEDMGIYRHWKENVWYPVDNKKIPTILTRFHAIDFEELMKNPESIHKWIKKVQVKRLVDSL